MYANVRFLGSPTHSRTYRYKVEDHDPRVGDYHVVWPSRAPALVVVVSITNKKGLATKVLGPKIYKEDCIREA